MKNGWVAHLFAALDQDAVAPATQPPGPKGDIDLHLAKDGDEFTAEIDYLDYLATLRIALTEAGDGDEVDVRVDCPLDEPKVDACKKAIRIEEPVLDDMDVEVRGARIAEGPYTLSALCGCVTGAGSLVRAVAAVVEAVGIVLEKMDEVWDPFEALGDNLDEEFLADIDDGISLDSFFGDWEGHDGSYR